MSIPQDQMMQMQQLFQQQQGASTQEPPQFPSGQGQPTMNLPEFNDFPQQPEDAGVEPYPEQFQLDSPEGQQMMQEAQEPEQRSLEETIQALNNFLYETITNKKLDLKVQTDSVKTLTDSLVNILSLMQSGGENEERRKDELHGLDLEHKMMMNKLEAKGKVDEIGRSTELHEMDKRHKEEQHQSSLSQLQQKSEIERVNTHQSLVHNEERHQADLEASKRESLKASKESSKS